MEDFASQIGQILNNPQAMSQIQNLAASLGLGGSPPAPQQAPPPPLQTPAPPNNNSGGIDTGMLMNMLGSLMGANNGGTENSSAAPPPPQIDMNAILSIQKAMNMFQASNQNVELLRALRPHFSAERQKKVDDAIRLMQLVNVLPLIKESGLFGMGGDR